MTDLRKAAEISIDAMISGDVHKLAVAIVELRQALAQPEREQYVTRVVAMHEDGTYTTEQIPLPKREWVGLTGNEAKDFYEKYTNREELIYAIDEFLEKKNT